MGERYLVTGVQLGILASVIENDKNKQILVDKIIDNQFVCNSKNDIKEDAKNCTIKNE